MAVEYVYVCPKCGHSWSAKAREGETAALCVKCKVAIGHSIAQYAVKRRKPGAK